LGTFKLDSALIQCLSHVSVDSAYAEPTTKNRKNVPYYQRKNIIKIGMQNIIPFTLQQQLQCDDFLFSIFFFKGKP
jgi:hypothetical protein